MVTTIQGCKAAPIGVKLFWCGAIVPVYMQMEKEIKKTAATIPLGWLWFCI
ncbi:hypothetical protein [Xanthomonas sp. BRIP62411]|uniref:hypothetical protein n=1 Tax=Xanthomonas sp. BRIP62411 TaxID=2182389 RepID=UPI0013E08B30|nr:hypothetical protein [Xanthomonas sp. BRIP62411]